jgi:hypothetical protein
MSLFALATAVALAAPGTRPPGTLPALPDAPPFAGHAQPLPADIITKMTGVTWREGCPVPLSGLAWLEVRHWGLDGTAHTGHIIVANDHADAILGVFEALWGARFPIHTVRPAHEFGGDDNAMMRANNTSAFNCRPVAGSSRFSDHSYGYALDLNPLINPYVRGDKVSPPQGRAYLDRDADIPGLIHADGPVVAAFAAAGWPWGGNWTRAKDYQHFSATGR